MKLIRILIAFLLIGGSGVAYAQDSVLFVGGAPLNTYQPRVIIALLTEAFNRNGIKFKAAHYPSSRSLLMVDSGEADGELHRVYDFHAVSEGKYPNLVRIDSQLMTVRLAVYAAGEGSPISDWEQLQGNSIGYLRGRQNVKEHLELISGDVRQQNTELGLFKMVAAGRITYAISEVFEGQRIIASHPELHMIQEVGHLEETLIYAYMNKKHEKLAQTVATTLDEMKRDGSFTIITNKIRQEILMEMQN